MLPADPNPFGLGFMCLMMLGVVIAMALGLDQPPTTKK